MSLRILLIATIVVALSAIGISELMVRPHLQSLSNARNKALLDFQTEKQAHRQAAAVLKDDLQKLTATAKELDSTKAQLAAATIKTADQEKRLANLDQNLSVIKQQLTGAKADLAAWTANGIPVDQIRSLIAEVKTLRATNEALIKETSILIARLMDAQQTIVDTFPNDSEPLLPTDLKGRVLAVDPKFDFVVLDIGETKGARPLGSLLVSRNSKLIAKVKIARVEKDRSIANIVPGWKLSQINEGDDVIVR